MGRIGFYENIIKYPCKSVPLVAILFYKIFFCTEFCKLHLCIFFLFLQWSKISQPFALQTTRKDILVHDPSFTQYRTLSELFPNDSTCFLLGNMAQYGCQGSVMQIAPEHRGRIQMNFIEPKEMDLSQVISDRASLTPA